MTTETISAKDVMKLRNETGAGMMDCKKALAESGGDFNKAIDYLRKKGQKVAASRAGRDSKEGVCIALVNDAATRGVMVQLNCETDFVAKNEDFISMGNALAKLALEQKPSSVEDLGKLNWDGATVAQKLDDAMARIGEKVEVSAYQQLEGQYVYGYTHMNYRVAALVSASKKVEEAVKNVALQVASMKPIALDKDGVPTDVIQRELEIAKEQLRAEGKPEQMIEQIAQGKLGKFFKEQTLMQQEFFGEGKQSVTQMVQSYDKDLKITAFCRMELGSN